jgi:hypothetical protein
LREIYERSARNFTATFLDGNQDLAAPTTARWKLYNVTAQLEVIPWTAIASPGTSETVTIGASYNKIRTGAKKEFMELTFQSDYGDEDLQQTSVLRYAIKNVAGVNDSDGT